MALIPIKVVKKLLRSYGLKPKRKLGQHFLLDKALMERLADQAELGPGDTVLDIGAGLGFLTEVLASRGPRVLAVEVDRGLARLLRDRLAHYPNVQVIEGDVLEVELPPFNKSVSAPPYALSLIHI